MKVTIVKQVNFLAKDKDGNYYPLDNFGQEYYEQIEQSGVEGILIDTKVHNSKSIIKKFRIR